jgi:phage terminase large subunit-like protein
MRKLRPKRVRVGKEVFVFDVAKAARAVRFIETCCKHYQGDLAGQLMVLEPWQKWIVEEIFGWHRPNGTRRYRKVFIFVPRKNGKTQLIAAIMLYLMIADGEAGAKCYAAAADENQARMIFDASSMIVQQNETLAECCVLFKKSITYPETASACYVISSKPNTKHGLNAHGVLIDELHAHESRELYDVLMTSRGSRKRSLAVIITTAGRTDTTSICHQEYLYAKRAAADPEVAPYLLPVLFEAPNDADWREEKTWHQANPGLAGGEMIQIDYMRDECLKAIEDPSYENTFCQLQLNRWVEQATRWIPIDRWNACRGRPPFAPDVAGGDPLAGRPCYLAIDLSSKVDLTCVAELYPFELPLRDGDDPETARNWGVYVNAHFWTPTYRLKAREVLDHASYSLWAKRGSITIVDESVIPESVIESHVKRLDQTRAVKRIVFDRWGMAGLGSRLQKEYGEDRVIVQGQGYQLSSACREFFAAMLSGRLIHPGNDVLDYCAANVAIKTDDLERIKPVKSMSGGRIDGITALVTGMQHVILDPLESVHRRSRYDQHEMIIL